MGAGVARQRKSKEENHEMESPSASEGCRVVAQEDSSSVEKQPLSTCLAEADQAEKIVPNFGDETTVQERTSGQESPVKFHEPDFAFVEMTSRLSNDEEDGKDSIEDAEKPSASLETRDDPKDVATTSGVHPEDDSPLKKLADTKEPVDIENVMYDENFLSDEASATSSIESTTVKKRQTGDFLPINAEIKRIGLEISEEQAKQLKNDVRRLSPVLVSLRERTLGEISLTSDSGLFEENDQVPRLENIEVPVPQDSTESSNQPEQVSALPSTSDSTSVLEECGSGATSESRASSSLDNVPPASAISRVCEETKNNREVIESKTMNDERVSECLQVDEKSKCPDSPVASTVLNACSTPNDRSNVQRELMIVLSRVDDDDGSTLDGVKESGVPEEAGTTEERSLELLSQRVSVDPENLVTKVANKNEVIGDSVVLVGDVCLAPKYHDNDQLRRKSPKVVIERTLEDSPSPKVTTDERVECSAEVLLRENLDCVRRTLVDDLDGGEDEEDVSSSGDPLAINEDNLGETRSDPSIDAASDIQESFDTETETETCSDNSEIVSIASIHSGDCQERINDGTVCPESDSVVSDEIPGDPLTRLQPERPEAFTEDSAESLALATGARDEVRSDGSDSGLGSEIPGDPGPAPAPESDSETSFLDRIPDDILSDKDKVVNALETFVPDPGTSGLEQQPQQHQQLDIHPQQQIPLPRFLTPPKSSLKRRLTDCMEGEPSPKRINTDDPSRKKRNIQFDAVTVYYFPRAQGFTCVPSQGGSTLGMSATHTHAERFSLTEHAAEQRRLHRARLAQLRSERAATCVTEAASSSEDPSDDTDEEPSDTEELDIDSYYFLQPVPTWQRRALLRAAGVRRIDAVEKDDCRDIRASREHCGCGCKGYCDPESCPCSRANVKCQVDRAGFPCGCSRDGCANSSGRIEFNPVRVRTHFIHTLMRLQLEKKQRDEDRTDHELLMNNQMGRGPMREAPGLMGTTLGSMDHQNVIIGDTASCVTTGGFTTLHYESHDQSSTSCQPGIVHTAREDSLDLYAIRDDCYPPDEVDGGPNSQRKLHPEFGQAFQAFPGQQPAVSFPQTAYQDYQGYQALPSTSRSQFQPQFQPVPPANPTFSHYSYGQDSGVMQPSCQTHPTSHHPSVYETAFSQEDPSSSQQQYTNLNSVQPMNAVVQQMGKLEPFSELLAGRYSYYGDPEPQPITVAYHNNPSTKIEPEKTDIIDQQPVDANAEDCDENFGEIIKKSMVETVSA